MSRIPASTLRIVVGGHICLDIIPGLNSISTKAENFFTPGSLLETAPLTFSTGGAVANTGLALTKWGICTTLMAKIGNDPSGELIKQLLSRYTAAEGLQVAEGEATACTVILSPGEYDRMFLYSPGANHSFSYEDISFKTIAGAKLFHLGYPPLLPRLCQKKGRQLKKIFRRVKELGVTTSLDMTLPDPASTGGQADWKVILKNVLPYVDIFFPSAPELLYMLDRPGYEAHLKQSPDDILPYVSGAELNTLGNHILGMGGKILGIKCGIRGIYLRTADDLDLPSLGKDWAGREFWAPAYHAKHNNGTTGAGDAAIAGFLVAFLQGYSPGEAVCIAQAAGAANVRAPDAISGLGSWKETTAVLKEKRKTEPLTVNDPGWRKGPEGIWRGPKETI